MQINQISIILPSVVAVLAVAVSWSALTVSRLRADSARRQHERESVMLAYLAVTRIEGKRAREANASKVGPVAPARQATGSAAL